MADKLKIGQKVYTFGGMGLPRGMAVVTGIAMSKIKEETYAVKASDGKVYGAAWFELMDEKDAIAHAYAIFKGFSE